MSPWSKLFITVGLLALLGLGLCGVGLLRPAAAGPNAVGAAFLGFALCLAAVLTAIIGTIWLAATQDSRNSKNKP